MRTLKLWFKQTFCWHSYQRIWDEQFRVTATHGTDRGSVKLALLRCRKCGKEDILPHDRVYISGVHKQEKTFRR